MRVCAYVNGVQKIESIVKLQNFKLSEHGRSMISIIFLQISLASEQMLQVCRFREMWLEFNVRDISTGQRITSCNIDIRQGPNHATLHKTLKLILRKVIKVAWHYRCQENCKCIFPEFHEVYVLVKDFIYGLKSHEARQLSYPYKFKHKHFIWHELLWR